MPIPVQTLERWAAPVASGPSKLTHGAVRAALANSDWPRGLTHDVYLQGSYKNDTNVTADSDVDVVAELTSTFLPDVSLLSPSQRAATVAEFEPAQHRLEQFRADVVKALCTAFGDRYVTSGNKAIRVDGSNGRLPADVIVCHTYRLYHANGTCTYGISFVTARDGRTVINFPNQHYRNGVAKNQRTGGLYKPVVRMFKNARNELVRQGKLATETVPSYCIECLLFNAPDHKFHADLLAAYSSIVLWMLDSELSEIPCQNQLQSLFGTSPDQWNVNAAHELASGLAELLVKTS